MPGDGVRAGQALRRGERGDADGIGRITRRAGQQASEHLAHVVGPMPSMIDQHRVWAISSERTHLVHVRRGLHQAHQHRQDVDHRGEPTRNSTRSEAAQRLHSVCASTFQK